MYHLDQEKARKILNAENIKAYQIDILLKNFPPVPDEIGTLVEQWFVDQNIPDLIVDGISIDEVMNKRHAHFLVAIRDLSRLLDPSLSDEMRKKWRKILTTTLYYE